MKKVLFFLSLPLILAGCSSDEDNSPAPKGKGAIRITADVDLGVEEIITRATSTDVNTFTILLTDSEDATTTMQFPAGGVISDLDPGDYTLTVTSHADGIPAPAFDVQVYSATADVSVRKDATEPVPMVCKQINAGVFFEYDQSLTDAGLTEVVPTMTSAEGALVFENSSTATGYFAPGTVSLTVKNGNTELKIGGNANKDYTFAAEQLWKIVLSAAASPEVGGILINATVEEVTVPNQTDDAVLDIPEPVGTSLTVSAAELAGVTAEQISAVRELTVTGTTMTSAAWSKIKEFTAIETLTLADYTGQIPYNTFWSGSASTLPATLTTFSAPEMTLSLMENTFRGASSLVTVNLPKIGTLQGGSNFRDCTSLKNVTLTALRSTDNNTFRGCTSLEELSMPSVQSLWEDDFNGCTALKTLRLGWSGKIQIEAAAFPAGMTSNIDLYLNSAGSEFGAVSGNSWKGFTWKSINGYDL